MSDVALYSGTTEKELISLRFFVFEKNNEEKDTDNFSKGKTLLNGICLCISDIIT